MAEPGSERPPLVVESRSAVLRRRHRRILRWSLGVAVAAHVVVFLFVPWLRDDLGLGPGTELVGGAAPLPGSVAIDVIFDPPAIVVHADSVAREPEWRVLAASRLVPPPPRCAAQDWFESEYAKGEVRLLVGDSGRPDTVSVARTTGDGCWDAVMVGLAGDLRYRWLPSDDFAAPVEVFQPVTMSLTGY